LRRLLRTLLAVIGFGAVRRRARRRHEEAQARRAERPTEPDRRAENLVVAALLLAAAAALAFVVLYLVTPNTQLLGLTFGGALALLGLAAALAGKRVVSQEQAAEEYPEFGDERAQGDVQAVVEESGSSISRRRLLLGAAGLAGGALGAAALLPAASLGPNVDGTIAATPWRRGRRVVSRDDKLIRAEEVSESTFVTGFPEGATKESLGAPLIIVRVPAPELRLPPDRLAGAPDGIIAFSKICPHAGCAVSMYRHPRFRPTAPKPALVCPCHYSTFDPSRGGKLLFGPAGRDLPQLPLQITAAGELEAGGDFYESIGPSYGRSREKPGRKD